MPECTQKIVFHSITKGNSMCCKTGGALFVEGNQLSYRALSHPVFSKKFEANSCKILGVY